MTTKKSRRISKYAKYLFLSALVLTSAILTTLSFCAQVPENCGDGQKLESGMFCFDGMAYKKCGGSEYDPAKKFCSPQGRLEDKCGGKADFDPDREFCYKGKVVAKCGGDEYDPVTQGCFYGAVSAKCGTNSFDSANQFCSNITNGTIYDKCDGAIFVPPKSCNGSPVLPVCGTEHYNPDSFYCNSNNVYINGAAAGPICKGVVYDTEKKFCYNGKTYDKCAGQIYNPTVQTCKGSEVVNIQEPGKFYVSLESAGTGASGGGNYKSNDKVILIAGTPPADYYFRKWEVEGVNIEEPYKDTAVFYMPSKNVNAKAVFEFVLWDRRNDKKYKTVKMPDGKTWMAENLNYETDGDWANHSWCYNDSISNCEVYGRLYDFAAAMRVPITYNTSTWTESDVERQGVCPSGWHLPSNAEWDDMIKSTGDKATAGRMLKSSRLWRTSKNEYIGTDNYGFSALPGGQRSTRYNAYGDKTNEGYWWAAASGTLTTTSYAEKMTSSSNGVGSNSNYIKVNGHSVRCVQDG